MVLAHWVGMSNNHGGVSKTEPAPPTQSTTLRRYTMYDDITDHPELLEDDYYYDDDVDEAYDIAEDGIEEWSDEAFDE